MWKCFLVLSLLVFASCEGNIRTNANTGNEEPPVNPPGVGYQLDATLAEIQALDPSAVALTMSNNNQTASLTWIGAGQGGAAAPANFMTTPQTLDLSSGKKAFECEYSMPAGLVSGYSVPNGTIRSGTHSCLIYTPPFTPVFMAEIRWGNDGTYDVKIYNGSFIEIYDEENVSYQNLPSKIGFEFNATTQTVSIYINNVKKVLSDDSYTPQEVGIMLALSESADQAHIQNAGKVSTLRLITTAGDMTTNFSSGTTDPFGDPL